MKRILKLLTLLCIAATLVFAACTNETQGGSTTGGGSEDQTQTTPPEKVVTVTATENAITIKDTEVDSYDFTALFVITEDGEEKEVLPSYLQGEVEKTAGTYRVACVYGGRRAFVDVTVVETVYTLELSQEEISLKCAAVADADFKSFFTAKRDGEEDAITEEMVKSDVKPQEGDYSYTVVYHGIEKTLTVHVLPDHTAEIILTYSDPVLHVSELKDFDVTTLFSLYVDGAAVEVTEELITESGLLQAKAGDEVEVTLSYHGIVEAEASVTVRVVADEELVLSARNVVTYPNAAPIDLASLFTIKRGDEEIAATSDMIEGYIDYSVAGDNTITLSYGGKTATAIVTVKLGVVIGYKSGDIVTVLVGTDPASYPFAGDFEIVVNGDKFHNIPDAWFDLSKIDFSKEGDCTATISVPYNDQPYSSDPSFAFSSVTAQITYHVVTASYKLSLKEEVVRIPQGSNFDPTSNLLLSVNRDGRDVGQGFTTNKDWVSAITTYYELVQGPDLSSYLPQEIRLKLYVYGVESDPIEVSYTVIPETEAEIVARDRIAFVGQTLYARDLFTVTKGGKSVTVPQEAFSGKVDTFHEGVYTVTLNYEGETVSAQVIVYPAAFVGVYRTTLKTIPEQEEDEDEGEGDYGWGGGGYISAEDTPAVIAEGIPLGALTINEDGTIRFNAMTVTNITGIDAHTMRIRISSWDFTLHYEDGIIVLDPDNALRMKFNESCRPFVYYSQELWDIREPLTVNYGSSHVLETDYSNVYSFDMAHLRSKKDGTEKWYTLYVHLLQAMSSNVDYDVKWGEVTFKGEYDPTVGAKNSFSFGGLDYAFTVTGTDLGKIDREANENPYLGRRFTGTVGGQGATLSVALSGYDLTVGGSLRLSVPSTTASAMKHGGILEDGSIFLYEIGNSAYGTYSYYFTIDSAQNTFTLKERDPYFGVYERGTMRFFLDGYGMGTFCDNTKTSKSTTELTYRVNGSEITVAFVTFERNYAYGRTASFYIANTLNILTVKSSENDILAGGTFVNTFITDGAIITCTTELLTASRSMRDELIESVIVITKDGELSTEEKREIIGVEALALKQSGFCEYTVTVEVCGKSVVSHHAVQVVVQTYNANDPLIGMYGAGAIHGTGFGLILDVYGQAYVTLGATTFSGLFSLSEDGKTLVAKTFDSQGTYLCLKGTVLADGILRVECSGAVNYVDYLTQGKIEVAGCDGYVLWKLTNGAVTVYIASADRNTAGEAVTVTETGTAGEYTITAADGSERTARIEWGTDATKGLTFSEE